MSTKIKEKLVKNINKNRIDETTAEILEDFKFKTDKKNQLVAFFKPESFTDKTPQQIEKLIDLVFKKFADYEVSIDGAAIFPGPSLGKHQIMDRHYGVINQLSKNASKILSDEEKSHVRNTLKLDKKVRILGGHEAFEISGIDSAEAFDKYWLESTSTKIKSGFYVRDMEIANETVVVVNGFHPHQLNHYTAGGKKLGVLLISSNTSWSIVRDQMLGISFPDKAEPESIRGTLHRKPKDYGFETVMIENNVLHISAGPTEALFEMDNFLKGPFGTDIISGESLLSSLLLKEGFSKEEIRNLMNDKDLHGELEHKDTDEAMKIIKSKKRSN